MYTTQLRVSNYQKDTHYTVELNASWVTIRDAKTQEIVWKREPDNDDWYDERHKAIVKAIYAFEEAILAAAE